MDQDVKERDFVILLSHESRIRHYHSRLKQQVVEFMVQLEVNIKGEWKPVVRYDTAHGFAHRDIFHGDGRVEKVPLSIGDYNSTLAFAELDVRSNWELYRQRFLQEVKNHD
jgi:hypothetical protein